MNTRDKEQLELRHLIAASEADALLTQTLLGHLALETLLVTLITIKFPSPDFTDFFEFSFPQKVKLAQSLNILDAALAQLLLRLNYVRNRYGHSLGYKIDAAEMAKLLELAKRVHGIDFTEISNHLDLSRKPNRRIVLSQIFNLTAACLDFNIEAEGGAAPLF